MSLNLIFFSVILVAGLICFLVSFAAGSKKSFLSPLFLLTGSILIGFCFLEGGSWFIKTRFSSKGGYPNAPQIIFKFQTPIFVRIKNSILYLPPPKKNFRTFGHVFKTNGLGFREKPFTLKKPARTFRILVFGDSLTFGVAVANEQRYSNLLENMLNVTYEGEKTMFNRRIEILNFGVPGYSLDQERDLMEAILKIVECDLVILGIIEDDLKMTTRSALKGFTLNKGKDSISINLYKNPERTFESIPEVEPKSFSGAPDFYDYFYFYKILQKRTKWFAPMALPNLKRWNYALNEFMQIKSLTQKYGLLPPIVALLHYGGVDPDDNDFENPAGKIADNIEIMRFISSELAPLGFNVVDTLPMFKEFNRMALAVSEWEWHPNYLAHYIYAQSILNVLLDRNLLR